MLAAMGSVTQQPIAAGHYASHQRAPAFCLLVQQLHHRYANEVVGAFSLCPHMKDPHSAFGYFCVVLDEQLDIETAIAQVRAADGQMAHLVYPLVTVGSGDFERFGNKLHQQIAKRLPSPPVHACFHPQMRGDRLTASRRVGLVRRAPDPFVQFVPDGLHQGGTSFLDPAKADLAALFNNGPTVHHPSLADLSDSQLDALEAKLIAIRRDRDERYAPFIAQLKNT